MKKILPVILAGLALYPLTVCMAQTPDLTGVWYLITISEAGEDYDCANLGMDITLTLNEDDTCILTSADEEEQSEGTWCTEEDGATLTIDGEAMKATINEDAIILDAGDDIIMTFGREKPEAFVPAKTVAAKDIAEFNGTWEADILEMDGTYVPVSNVMDELGEMLDMKTAKITINNGVAEIFGAEESQGFPLVDGALLLDEEEPEDLDEGMSDQKIELLEDGGIAYTVMNIVFYCNPAVRE